MQAFSITDMPIEVKYTDIEIGTIREGGHGANKNGNYSCSQCN